VQRDIKTDIQHYGEDYQRFLGAIAPPIFEASNFAFSSYEEVEEFQKGEVDKFVYTRGGNPNYKTSGN